MSRLFRDREPGAVLDLLDALLLTAGTFALVRRPPPAAILVAGAIALSGWASNLLDRLGLHFITAPRSARGAVDFIHIGKYFYNIADLMITLGTSSFVLLLAIDHLIRHLPAIRAAARRRPLPTRKLLIVTAGLMALIVTVSIGAAHDGGASTAYASRTAAAS